MLRNTAVQSGLEPVKLRYFFGALFPAAAATRIADRLLSRGKEAKASALGSVPGPLNKALIGIHDIERMLMMPWNTLFGVSAFCTAVKPAD